MKDSEGTAGDSERGCAAGLVASVHESSLKECLRRAVLLELPASDRLLLLLWYAEGMSREEIAACLHSTPAQVEAAHGRVLAWLRRIAAGTPAGAA